MLTKLLNLAPVPAALGGVDILPVQIWSICDIGNTTVFFIYLYSNFCLVLTNKVYVDITQHSITQ